MEDLSVIVLAAGDSSRLGVSKQMINYHGKSLVRIACDRALQLSTRVTVVTGAHHHRVESEFNGLQLDRVYNPNWEQGLGSSLALAIKHDFNCKRCLVMYCDQPHIPIDHYHALIEKSAQEPEKIIATEYRDQFDIPAIFPHRLYYELTVLTEDQTPETVITSHMSDVRSITCDQAAFSVDTPADMAQLKAY